MCVCDQVCLINNVQCTVYYVSDHLFLLCVPRWFSLPLRVCSSKEISIASYQLWNDWLALLMCRLRKRRRLFSELTAAATEMSLNRTEFLSTSSLLCTFTAQWKNTESNEQNQLNKQNKNRLISSYTHFCHCGESWLSAVPWCYVKQKVENTQEVMFCWKILVQQRGDQRAWGLDWKVFWPFSNLSLVVSFVFLVVRGLTGSDWGVQSQSQTEQINGWMRLLHVKQPKCLALE